jgi:hypothetical protein
MQLPVVTCPCRVSRPCDCTLRMLQWASVSQSMQRRCCHVCSVTHMMPCYPVLDGIDDPQLQSACVACILRAHKHARSVYMLQYQRCFLCVMPCRSLHASTIAARAAQVEVPQASTQPGRQSGFLCLTWPLLIVVNGNHLPKPVVYSLCMSKRCSCNGQAPAQGK